MATLEPTVERRDYEVPLIKRTAWGALFAGTFVALGVMTLLATLGIAIGATTIDPASGDTPGIRTFGIGAGIWWLLTGIAGLFAGGWTAGRLAGYRRRLEGPLHGIVTWALTGVVTVALLTNVLGWMLGGALNMIGTTMKLAGSVGAQVQETTGVTPSEVQERVEQRIDKAQQQGAPLDERARESAVQAAETAAEAVATAAWWSFIYFLLTAGAAALGGWLGSPHRRTASAGPTRTTMRTDPVVPPQAPPTA